MSRALAFVVREFHEMLPPTIFFAVGFNVIVLTTNLVLDDYGMRVASFMLATAAALVVGKAVLVANALPFLRRLDTAPLIQPVLYKSAIYFAVVFVVRLLEQIIEYALHGGSLAGVPGYLSVHFSWNRFLAVQLWILVLFLMYSFVSELNALFGDGELYRVMFMWRSTHVKLTRRQRIRTLVKLSRLTARHTIEEFRDAATPAHADLIALLRGLAMQQVDPPAAARTTRGPVAESAAAGPR